MTDRHAGYLVSLEVDIREDDAKAVLDALRMVKGVLRVEPVVANPVSGIEENRARHKILMMLIDAVRKD